MERVDFQISDGTALVSLEKCLKRSFNLQATDLIMPDPLRKLALCHNGVSLRDIARGAARGEPLIEGSVNAVFAGWIGGAIGRRRPSPFTILRLLLLDYMK